MLPLRTKFSSGALCLYSVLRTWPIFTLSLQKALCCYLLCLYLLQNIISFCNISFSALLQATIWTTGSACRCWKGTELKPRRRSYRPLHPLQAPSPLPSHLITPGTLNSAPSAIPTRCRGIRQLLRALLHIEVSQENNNFVLLNCKIH